MTTPLDFALAYASRGRVVMPLGRLGNRPHQMLGRFGGFDVVGSTDEEQIRGWWAKDPAANVGIVTGRRSNVVVLDIDFKRVNGFESLTNWQVETGITLPPTQMARTPSGGMHVWFWLPPREDRLPKKIGWLPGVDFCADGCQVAAPPSIREIVHHLPDRESWSSRVEYEWEQLEPLAPAPEALIADALERPPTITSSLTGETRPYRGELPKLEWFREYGFGACTGSRNTDCLRLARRRFRENLGNRLRVTEEVLSVYVRTYDHNSFPRWEVEKVLDQAERYWLNRYDWYKKETVGEGKSIWSKE